MTVWALIPLLNSLAYVALLIVTLQSARNRLNRLFAYHLIVAGFWGFTSFMLHLNAFPRQALFWNEILTAALIGTLITYYHFLRAYINKPAGIGVYLGYGYLAVMTVLLFKGYIVQYAYVVDGVLYHSLGNALYFIGAVCLVFVFGGLYLLVRKYRGSLDPVERNRTMYLIAGWSVMMVFAYTNLIPAVAGFPLDHIGNLGNALIIAYAIRKYRLLDIRLVIRKGLVYSSLTILLTVIYALLLIIVQMFLGGWGGYTSIALAAGFALSVTLLLNPTRDLIQRSIDRLFYRETYDYRQMQLNFSGKISNVLDLGELAQSMLDPLVTAMHAGKAALLFPENDSNDFVVRFAQQAPGENPMDSLRLVNDSPIVIWLTNEGKVIKRETLDIVPQLKGLWEAERTIFDTAVDLLCPVRSKGRLIGILALGKKQSHTSYSNEETDLLMTMANEAAIVVENARMLDSLQNQQRRVEQLLTQAVLAQEEERKRISADLHDSVAQWLVGASYRAQTCNEILFGEGNGHTKHGNGNGDGKARSELLEMESTINKSLKELRRVVIGLRPPALDELGLTHALRQSLEELKVDGIECKFSQIGTPVRLTPSVEIAVYRVVQEAFNNIRKHANATKVNLRLQFQPDKFSVEVRDNGKGFDLSHTIDGAVSGGHVGLLGMKQRAEMLGGDFKIRTGKAIGTAIILSLPTQPQSEAR
ncbi:MAG: histidine kinase [Chloroflexota bacterium]